MSRQALIVAAFLLLGLWPAQAHGPTPQKAEESVTIAASPEAVWKIAGNFAGIGAWHPLVKNVKATGGSAEGSERIVLLEKGEIADSLDQYDSAGRTYGYRLAKENVEALPVSFYTAVLSVTDAGGGKSNVVWSARFYRGDTGNFPADELNDEAAVAAMTDFFRRGLDGLKARIEGK